MKRVLEDRNKEADRRYERASKVAQRIFQNQELKMKQEEDQRNEEFARQLQLQEREQLKRQEAERNSAAERESKVVQIMQEVPEIEWEQAQFLLEENNFDLGTALARAKSQNQSLLKFKLVGSNREFEQKFSPHEEGMALITFLNSKESSGNMYYKLFRDASC